MELYDDTEPHQRIETHLSVDTYSALAAFDAAVEWLQANYIPAYESLDADAFEAICRSPDEPFGSVAADKVAAAAVLDRAKCREAYGSIKVYTIAEWVRHVTSRCGFIHYAPSAVDIMTVEAASASVAITAAAAVVATAGRVGSAATTGRVGSVADVGERKGGGEGGGGAPATVLSLGHTRQLYRCILTAEQKMPESSVSLLAAAAGIDYCAEEQVQKHMVCYSTSIAQALVLVGCWLTGCGHTYTQIAVVTENEWWSFDDGRCVDV